MSKRHSQKSGPKSDGRSRGDIKFTLNRRHTNSRDDRGGDQYRVKKSAARNRQFWHVWAKIASKGSDILSTRHCGLFVSRKWMSDANGICLLTCRGNFWTPLSEFANKLEFDFSEDCSVELANSRPIQQLFDVPEIEYYGNNNFGILYTKLKAVHNFDICRDGEVVLELLIAYLQVTITYCGKILNYEAANMIQPSLDELTILHQELCQEWCNNEAIVDLWSKLQGLATQLRLYESRVAFLEYEPAGLDGIDFQNLCSIRQRKEEVQNDIDAKYSELSALCSPRISNKRCSRLRREIYRMQDAELELRRWGVFGTGRAS
ncbi:hypothetical protein B0O99DRAFT_588814 [Bisporella sp. PMI_857]|nr:hypothetical protein B0O99DRAFT_588814 [Bisporella sp. PMI_857]